MIGDALIRAAQRGVKVFLIVDGYASQGLDGDFILALKEKGIQFRYFEPLFRSRRFYLGRRLHHKVCVSDMRFALVGGVNVANHYNDLPESPAWLDFALHVEGEIVKELLVLCQKTWNGFRPLSKIPKMMDAPMFSFPENAKVKMRMRRNDWVRRKSQISSSYLEMLRNAKSEIYILSSYFLPGSIFRKALRQAAERGVKISVILAGTSDVKIAKLAERYMYEWLLSRGITIMEYNPTVLHGKLAICDGKWLTLGSFNVNDISTYASVEL
ncbi:MAG: phospholipase D-like domain-containing protein, partial [Cyclobacteriaceae bacterium]